jgi:hypothetical protein
MRSHRSRVTLMSVASLTPVGATSAVTNLGDAVAFWQLSWSFTAGQREKNDSYR